MPEINARQALIISGAQILENNNGTAPGMLITEGKCTVVLLPGPPREMKPIFDASVAPALKQRVGDMLIVRRTLNIFGLTESRVDELAAPIYTKYRNPSTTILFKDGQIELHLTAQSRNDGEASKLLDELSGQLDEILDEYIFSRRTKRSKRSSVNYSNCEATRWRRLKAAPADCLPDASLKCRAARNIFSKAWSVIPTNRKMIYWAYRRNGSRNMARSASRSPERWPPAFANAPVRLSASVLRASRGRAEARLINRSVWFTLRSRTIRKQRLGNSFFPATASSFAPCRSMRRWIWSDAGSSSGGLHPNGIQ